MHVLIPTRLGDRVQFCCECSLLIAVIRADDLHALQSTGYPADHWELWDQVLRLHHEHLGLVQTRKPALWPCWFRESDPIPDTQTGE